MSNSEPFYIISIKLDVGELDTSKYVRGELHAKRRLRELQEAAKVLGLCSDIYIKIKKIEVEEE